MNLLLKIARIYIPPFYKKKKLIELFELTARAFQSDISNIKGLSVDDCLHEYALFTKTQAEKAIKQNHSVQEIKQRLYRNAYQLGKELRKNFRITTMDEVMLMSRLLYHIIGIEFQGDSTGKVMITRCFFSQYYTSQVCQVISSLDEGVAAGLSGGGKLTFVQRMTEGYDCCKAHFKLTGNQP